MSIAALPHRAAQRAVSQQTVTFTEHTEVSVRGGSTEAASLRHLLGQALVLEEKVERLGLLTVVGDADTGAGHNLAGVALGVNLAEASPLAELGVVWDGHHVDAVLSAESLDELLVCWLRAVVGEDAEVHATLVKHAGALAKATGDAVMGNGLLEHLLEGRDSVEGFFLDDLLDWGSDFFNGGISARFKNTANKRQKRESTCFQERAIKGFAHTRDAPKDERSETQNKVPSRPWDRVEGMVEVGVAVRVAYSTSIVCLSFEFFTYAEKKQRQVSCALGRCGSAARSGAMLMTCV